MFYSDTVRARDWAVPLLGGSTLLVWAFVQPGEPGPGRMVVFTIAIVLLVIATVVGSVYLASTWTQIRTWLRDAEYRFSPNFQAEVIAKMNSDQLRAWSRSGRALVARIATENGPVDRIDGEPVFLFTAWHILKNSTDYSVHSINNYAQGGYQYDMLGLHEWDDYTQAKAFHAWLYWRGWVNPPNGNQSSRWVDGMTPEKVMQYLGLERDTWAIDDE